MDKLHRNQLANTTQTNYVSLDLKMELSICSSAPRTPGVAPRQRNCSEVGRRGGEEGGGSGLTQASLRGAMFANMLQHSR